MAVREDAKEIKKTGLEGLSRSELLERFILETIEYKSRLAKEDSPENLSIYISSFNQRVREEYMQRTKSLREEIEKREQMYKKYYHTFIGH